MDKIVFQAFRDDVNQPTTEIPLYGDVRRLGNTNRISDGRDDMYDGANIIGTNLDASIPYTHTQQRYAADDNEPDFLMDGTIASGAGMFGDGSSYFTNMYPGLFVLGAKGISIDEFSISGNIGADGDGSTTHGQFQLEQGGVWTCFYKCVYDDGGGDPLINHLILVRGSAAGITHDVPDDTEDDDDSISGIGDKSELYYALFATDVFSEEVPMLTAEQLEVIAREFIRNIRPSLSTTLTYLNNNYQDIVDLIPNMIIFADDGRETVGLGAPSALTYVGRNADFNSIFLATNDNGELYRITMRSRNFSDGADVVLVRDMEFPICGMAYLRGIVYMVWNSPFLIRADLDGNILNESDNDKFDRSLSVTDIHTLFVSDGELMGLSDSGLYIINVDTGECANQLERSFNSYDDVCATGVNPPPMENLFNGGSNIVWPIISGGEFGDGLIVEWSTAGLDTYGSPPADGWATAEYTVENISELDCVVLDKAQNGITSNDITVRSKYAGSNWIYGYWND